MSEGDKSVSESERPQNKNLRPPFKKGHKGLPGAGRPKGFRPWAVVIREQFETGKITQADLVIAMQRKARRGDVKATDLLWNRTDGKPLERHEVTNRNNLDEMTEEELNAELDRVNERLTQTEKGTHPGKA